MYATHRVHQLSQTRTPVREGAGWASAMAGAASRNDQTKLPAAPRATRRCKRRGTYDLYLSPIARALRAEGERAGAAREWTELECLNREGTGRQLVDEVLADRW